MVDVSQKHEYLAIKNVLSMGHCAPTVARTLLQSEGIEDPRLIKLMAAMPGGIGNSGAECGGVTAPLMYLGVRFGYDFSDENQVRVISLGQNHLRAFERLHRTVLCRDIRARGVLYPCLKAIYTAPDLILGTMDELARRDPYIGIPPPGASWSAGSRRHSAAPSVGISSIPERPIRSPGRRTCRRTEWTSAG